MYIDIYMYIYTYTSIYIYTYINMCIYMYAYRYASLCSCISLSIRPACAANTRATSRDGLKMSAATPISHLQLIRQLRGQARQANTASYKPLSADSTAEGTSAKGKENNDEFRSHNVLHVGPLIRG